MKKIKKYSFSIIAVVLTLIVGLYYSAGKLFSRKEITSNVRTVTLAETDIDYQALLDEFENGELIQEDNVTTFRGTQALDSSNCPYRIDIENPLTYSQMVTVMSTTGMSSLTDEMYDARRVLEGAVPASYPIFADIGVGVPHFQAADIKDPNYNANRGPSNNPRYKVAGKTLHSFWFA